MAENRYTLGSFVLGVLPVSTPATCFDLNQMKVSWEVNAAVVNVSGRQRMLSQRIALISLRLVFALDPSERDPLRQDLRDAIALLERSHQGLIYGDATLNLPGELSPTLQAMYFESPLHVDQQVRDYIAEVQKFAEIPDAELKPDNLHLNNILQAASTTLLAGLDAVVSQYQAESDAKRLAIQQNQFALYEQSCEAAENAQLQAQQIEQTLSKLQKTQTQLIQSEKMSSLGQLVAGVAHEINNPVNFIHGNLTYARDYMEDLLALLHLYQENYPDPAPAIRAFMREVDLEFLMQDAPKVLDSMQVGADRIRQIVLSLRNFSRLDEAEMKPVDIHQGIDSTLLILQNRLKARPEHPGIQVIKAYGDLPLVDCYAGQLNQVFMNILSNAIDALDSHVEARSPEDPQTTPSQITIATTLLNNETVQIRIADNGPGIPEAVQQRLFDPFFTTKPVGQGTGLGLSISYQVVVERHGGTLRCESQVGEGTAFVIEIPVQTTPKASTGQGMAPNAIAAV